MRFFATDEKVRIQGRTLIEGNTVYLGWSGSSVEFKFTGKRATAKLISDPERFDERLLARLAVFIDDEAEPSKRICLDKKEQTVTLFESDTNRTVTVKLMKLSEANFGCCGIEYIETESDGEQAKSDSLPELPEVKRLKLEIIGDSITCGYGVEAPNELTPFHTETENPTKSYSLLLAKKLNADVNLFCWSGNGLTSHWVDDKAVEPLVGNLMPELYPYTDKSLSERLYPDAPEKWEKWDFGRFQPDLILINLGTNDCSWCREIEERNDAFKAEYRKFLSTVRANNPKAYIVCMLGTMDKRLEKVMPVAVKEYRTEAGDDRIAYIELPMQTPDLDGYGADWHPSPSSQKKACEFIFTKLKEMNCI